MKPDPSPALNSAAPATDRLRVTRYDQVASFIVASLIVIGFMVAILAILVFTRRILVSRVVVGAELVEEVAGRGDHPAGFEEDYREPSMDSMQDLTTATSEILEAVTREDSSQLAATPEILEGAPMSTTQGRGDRRQPGPLGRGRNIVPRWERWEILFQSDKLETYAQQLDYFRIELGAIGGDQSHIEYASQLSSPRPSTRKAAGNLENRLYMTWKGGQLKAADEALLRKAGITTTKKILVQFLPADIENQLAQLERTKAGDRPLERILRTIFSVRRVGNRFEFFVTEQIVR